MTACRKFLQSPTNHRLSGSSTSSDGTGSISEETLLGFIEGGGAAGVKMSDLLKSSSRIKAVKIFAKILSLQAHRKLMCQQTGGLSSEIVIRLF